MTHPAPSIPPGPIKLSVHEFMELPNDGKRYEIIDGDLFVTPSPVPRHQRISRDLQTFLILALQKTGQGEVFAAPLDVVLDDHTIVAPDLIFIRTERLHIIGDKNIQGAPDLVVEILSPGTRRTDVLIKTGTYARFGVPSYWIADPDLDRLELYRLEGQAYVHRGTLSAPAVARPEEFPGLEIPLREVFG